MLRPAVLLAVLAAPSAAQEPGPPDPDAPSPEAPRLDASAAEPAADLWTFALGERWRLGVGPRESLYPPYVADPRRPTTSLTLVSADSGVDGAGNARLGLRFGARLELLHLYRADRPRGGLQLDVDAGMIAQFDRDSSQDNLGWDGIYAVHLSWAASERLALRAGLAHDSSHLGDEFIESTGRTRIDYTREEVLVGASWRLADAWRTYGEVGWARDLRNEDLMEEGRVQGGLEWEGAPLWGGRAAPYAALDVGAWEEDDWDANVTLQTGLALRVPGTRGTWRIGFEAYDGRSILGELFQAEERWIAFGLWFDP